MVDEKKGSFADLLKGFFSTLPKVGDLVKGKVVAIDAGEVRLDISGVITGVVLLLLFSGVQSLRRSPDQRSSGAPMQEGGMMLRSGEERNVPAPEGMDPAGRMERMAERLGMSMEELQQELDTGKTFSEIAEERGVDLSGGMGPGREGGFRGPDMLSGSGAVGSGRSMGPRGAGVPPDSEESDDTQPRP